MKRLTVLAWAFACSIFVLFTGCSGDDGPASMPGQSTDTNSNNSALSATNAPSSLGPQEVLTLSPSDLTGGPFHITMDQGNFTLPLPPNTQPEIGTVMYTPNGDNATVVLTATPAGTTRTINLIFTTPVRGSFTSDSLGSGAFTLQDTSGSGPF